MKYTLLRCKGSEEQPSGRICSATKHLMVLFSLNPRFPYLVETNRTWESTFQDYNTPAKTFYQPRGKHGKVPQFCSNLYQLRIIKKFDNGDGNIQVTALCWRKILVDNKARALTLEHSLNYDLLICQISQKLLSNNQNFDRGLKRGFLSFTSDTRLVRPQCWLWLLLPETITYPSECWTRHLVGSFKLGDVSHQTVFFFQQARSILVWSIMWQHFPRQTILHSKSIILNRYQNKGNSKITQLEVNSQNVNCMLAKCVSCCRGISLRHSFRRPICRC